HVVVTKCPRQDSLSNPAHALHGRDSGVSVLSFGEQRIAQSLQKLRPVDEILGQARSVVVTDQQFRRKYHTDALLNAFDQLWQLLGVETEIAEVEPLAGLELKRNIAVTLYPKREYAFSFVECSTLLSAADV